MFRWYQNATRCYVFLSDISVDCDDSEHARYLWEAAFRKSRWFTRGWTLQELLAPASVEFFSQEGRYLGSKGTLEGLIHEITSIPIAALRGTPLSHFPDEERLRWTTGRNTKRPEDQAYCLLGIFNIFMPLMYGEKENAIRRLQEKVGKRSRHKLSNHGKAWRRGSCVLRLLKTYDYEGAKLHSTRRIHGTCEWFVQNLDYERWRQKTTASLLWYSADPGCGKTVLARYLVDEVYGVSPLTLHSFFQRRDRQRNTLSTTLCAILHQLYCHRPNLLRYAENAYKEIGRQLLQEPTTLWRIFKQSVANSCDSEILCVLDALDECDIEQSKILFKLLLEEPLPLYSGTGTVKFIITSRPYYHVQQLFHKVNTRLPVFRVSGETESKSISQDVEIFIRSQVLRLNLRPKEGLEVERKLSQNRNRDQTFLWAFLITEQLCTNPPSTLKKLLSSIDQLPSTVIEAYEAILKNCADPRNTKKILSIIVAARQPLTLNQMDTILALEPQVKILQDLDLEGSERLAQTIRHTCGLFIKVADSKIYLIHQTAQDFLLSNQLTIPSNISNHPENMLWQHSIGKTQSHFEIASACIRFLSLEDVVCQSPSWHSCTNTLLRMSMANNTSLDSFDVIAYNKLIQIKEFAAYAKENWSFHVVETLRYLQAH